MQYFVSHYWQQEGTNGASLVLQQAYHKRRRMPVVLAAVGQEGSCEFATELVDWYYGTGLSLCSKYGEWGMQEIERHLRTLAEERETVEMTGILCVGTTFVIFKRGNMGIRLLNTRNNHFCCHELKMEQEDTARWCFQSGIMQPGVGLVLGNEFFYQSVSDELLAGYLKVQEMKNEKQVAQYLGELIRYTERQDKKQIGAVLLVAH